MGEKGIKSGLGGDIAPDKSPFPTKKYFSYFSKKTCCGYSLEVPHQGTSNEYHKICFLGEIRKIIYFLKIDSYYDMICDGVLSNFPVSSKWPRECLV